MWQYNLEDIKLSGITPVCPVCDNIPEKQRKEWTLSFGTWFLILQSMAGWFHCFGSEIVRQKEHLQWQERRGEMLTWKSGSRGYRKVPRTRYILYKQSSVIYTQPPHSHHFLISNQNKILIVQNPSSILVYFKYTRQISYSIQQCMNSYWERQREKPWVDEILRECRLLTRPQVCQGPGQQTVCAENVHHNHLHVYGLKTAPL